jgi:hypothetical protein
MGAMRGASGIQSNLAVLGLILGLMQLSGCGAITLGGRPSATCLPNTAQIEVYDTGMRRGCGCAEGASTQLFSGPNAFDCTVSINTTVYFTYVGTVNVHWVQANPANSCNFPYRDPAVSAVAGQVDACNLSSTATYSFTDVPTSNGMRIIVNP